mmetsp:Transcript_37213/g.105034  ORF Transcript_37213/g.105034 Transcript_37213/m.105034 type:complete len:311 (-) Transcript_37213:441-1373(-)
MLRRFGNMLGTGQGGVSMMPFQTNVWDARRTTFGDNGGIVVCLAAELDCNWGGSTGGGPLFRKRGSGRGRHGGRGVWLGCWRGGPGLGLGLHLGGRRARALLRVAAAFPDVVLLLPLAPQLPVLACVLCRLGGPGLRQAVLGPSPRHPADVAQPHVGGPGVVPLPRPPRRPLQPHQRLAAETQIGAQRHQLVLGQRAALHVQGHHDRPAAAERPARAHQLRRRVDGRQGAIWAARASSAARRTRVVRRRDFAPLPLGAAGAAVALARGEEVLCNVRGDFRRAAFEQFHVTRVHEGEERVEPVLRLLHAPA